MDYFVATSPLSFPFWYVAPVKIQLASLAQDDEIDDDLALNSIPLLPSL